MKHAKNMIQHFKFTRPLLILLLLIFILPGNAIAHGGKKHGGSQVTRYKVLQKAVQFYDTLLKQNKLEETWETHLVGIRILVKEEKGANIFIIAFERSESTPQTLYLFYNNAGEYTGANFTGK